MKWPLLVLASAVFLMLIPPREARADSIFLDPVTLRVCFNNSSGMTATSAVIRLVGNGSLSNPRESLSPGMGRSFRNEGDVIIIDNALIPPGEFCIYFEADALSLYGFDEAILFFSPDLMGESFRIDPLRDNVRIEALPEPTAAILLGLGLAGVAAARRRRGSKGKVT